MDTNEKEKLYIKQAEEARKNGNSPEAILLYLKSLEFDPDNALTWYRMGLLYHDLEDFSKALECYTKVLNLAPTFKDAILSSANAYYSLGNMDKSIQLYEQALAEEPDSKAYYVLGTLYYEQKNINDAIRCYEIAVKLDPNNAEAIQNLGGMYLSIGENEKAVEIMSPIAAQNDSFPLISFNLAVIYHNAGNMAKAIDFYKKAVKADSTLEQGFYNLGLCYLNENNYNQAMMNFRKLIKINADSEEAHYFLGKIYEHEALNDQALEEYNEVLKINPQHLLANFALGEFYYKKQNFSKAKTQFEKCKSLTSDSEVIEKLNSFLENIA